MKLPVRLENAVTKLYNAFHNGKLNAFDCKACAVGNIVGHGDWVGIGRDMRNHELIFGNGYPKIKDYDKNELSQIEKRFLTPWFNCSNAEWGVIGFDKERQFKGLCAVVEYLCELDKVPNVMDIKSLFEYENDKPKYELNEIL